jgi:hypothetical protein
MSNTTTTVFDSTQQTPENTTAPFEALPPTPKRSPGFTKEMRDKKIAEGWIPPEKRQKPEPKRGEGGQFISTKPQPEVIVKEDTESLQFLDTLVAKLVAMENNPQYRSVWLHFFNHGGVYNGPNYSVELRTAVDYLNSKKK